MNETIIKIIQKLLVFLRLKKPIKKEVKRLTYNKSESKYETTGKY